MGKRRVEGKTRKNPIWLFYALCAYDNGMEKRTLGRTGLSVSVLGVGTAVAAFLKTDHATYGKMLEELLDAGVNVVDTAAMYPQSEETLGKLIGHRRDEYYIVSKCGQKVLGVSGPDWSEQIVTETVDRALKNLGTTHLDVMLLHSCDLATLKRGDALSGLLKAKSAGKVRHIGYSGDNDTVAAAAAMPEIEVIETSINLVDQANIDLTLPAAMKHNVGVIAKRPIANAAWKPLSQQEGMYQNYAKTYHERFQKMNLSLEELGCQSWGDVALRFTLAQIGVTTAIVGISKLETARANLATLERGPLAVEAIEKIRKAFAEADPTHNWTGQT